MSRIFEMQRKKERSVDKIEYGCVGPNVQRQYKHRGRGKSGALAQKVKAIFEVLDDPGHVWLLLAYLFFDCPESICVSGPLTIRIQGRGMCSAKALGPHIHENKPSKNLVANWRRSLLLEIGDGCLHWTLA